jgi:hypothetical protein
VVDGSVVSKTNMSPIWRLITVGGEQMDQKFNMTVRQADKEQRQVRVTEKQNWRFVKVRSVLLVLQPSRK